MSNNPQTSTHVRQLLGRMNSGERAAVDELLAYTFERLRRLARRMLRGRPGLRAVDETDDVLQKAVVRLHRALTEVRPETTRAYFGLAAGHVRWVLADLARDLHRHDPSVHCSPPVSTSVPGCREPADPNGEPADFLAWAEFHEAVARLPDTDRAVFERLFYLGMTQAEAADDLGTSIRTVKRLWRAARLELDRLLHGDWPDVGAG